MEQYTWLVILFAWSLLLLLGLAGGDPLAVGQPGREAPLIKLARWAQRAAATRAAAHAAGAAHRERPAHFPPPARPSESGLHAAY
jgi:hypothetical protein